MIGKKFFDSSSLLELSENDFKELDNFIISSVTLQEVENIKSSFSKDDSIKHKARNVSRLLNKYRDKYHAIILENKHYDILNGLRLPFTNDNLILASAFDYYNNISHIILCTQDNNMRIIGHSIFKLDIEWTDNQIDEKELYTGYKYVVLSDDSMAYFYEHLDDNQYDLLYNEYLIIKNNKNEIVDKFKWNGMKHEKLKYKQVNTTYTDKVKPINPIQELAFDMLQDENITIKSLSGQFGSGKTFLMITNAIQLVKNNKYDKILWLRNNFEVKDTKAIGFLPSSKEDKLRHLLMSVADHCGGEEGLDRLLREKILEVEHLGFIRGRSFDRTIVLCNECENTSVAHLQLLITRIGKGSSLWLDGDCKQIDSSLFANSNNGLSKTVDRLKGQKVFGYVNLQECERSETAKLASLLDN